MLAELHCHSIYSTGTKIFVEGLNKPDEIVRHAKIIGLNCLALTDHNTMKGMTEAKKTARKYGILLIPGEEITTEAGHVLGLGINKAIKPELSLDETIDLIHKQGGIAVAAHPFDFRREGIGELAKKCDAIESFNALNLERTANWCAKTFAKKNKKSTTAGSDAHCLDMLGHGITDITCEHNLGSCLKAIKNGKTSMQKKYVPMNIIVWWTTQRLKYSYYYTINYMNNNYRLPKRFVGTKLIKLVNKSPGNIDYILRGVGYFSLGCIMLYSIFRNVIFKFKV